MEEKNKKLMIEENTIYEIDLDCLKRKQEQEKKKHQKREKRNGGQRKK